MQPSVPEMLRDAAKLYEQRNVIYGDNYKLFGRVMASLFPGGAYFETVEDWNRIGVFIQMVSKLTRYNQQWLNGHKDSLDDLTVYTMMLQELDNEMRSESMR